MATLMIRDLDDRIYESLRARAEANRHTVEDEARNMLEDGLSAARAAWAVELQTLRDHLREKYGNFPDSTLLIRQVRDEE